MERVQQQLSEDEVLLGRALRALEPFSQLPIFPSLQELDVADLVRAEVVLKALTARLLAQSPRSTVDSAAVS